MTAPTGWTSPMKYSPGSLGGTRRRYSAVWPPPAPAGASSAGPAEHTGDVRDPIGWNRDLYPLGPPPLAEKMTVAGAQARVGYPVPMPSTAAASRANLTQVWVASHNEGRTALVFDNGKVQILMHRATPQSDLRYFRAYVAQKNKNGAPGAAIGQVNGRPALVIPPKSAVVIFNRDGVSIGIYSNTYGTDTLLAIASSMQ